MLAGAVREGAAARLFDAVDQYGLCLRLLEDANERLAVAELYLDAARRARRSGSYEAALGLVRTATALLPQDRWNTCYRTSFELAVLGAECAAMHGEHAYAEAQLAAAGVHAEELVDAALATRLQVSLLTALDRSDEAVRTGLGFLSRLGPAWSFAPATRWRRSIAASCRGWARSRSAPSSTPPPSRTRYDWRPWKCWWR